MGNQHRPEPRAVARPDDAAPAIVTRVLRRIGEYLLKRGDMSFGVGRSGMCGKWVGIVREEFPLMFVAGRAQSGSNLPPTFAHGVAVKKALANVQVVVAAIALRNNLAFVNAVQGDAELCLLRMSNRWALRSTVVTPGDRVNCGAERWVSRVLLAYAAAWVSIAFGVAISRHVNSCRVSWCRTFPRMVRSCR